jgi:tRNA threonylcarbamoyladenosine biosynthesis protein TsaB
MAASLLLAFDTSTPTARVALVDPGGQIVAGVERVAERHSTVLLPAIDECLRTAGVSAGALAGIACGAGPGSFTGLRVGLAVAKGLALPLGLPLVLVPSLDALAIDLLAAAGARGGTGAGTLVACLDAGKGQIYARVYTASGDGPRPVDARAADWLLTPADLCDRLGTAVVLGGHGVDRYLAVFTERMGPAAVIAGIPGPSAASVACLALPRLAADDVDDLDAAVPRYGRPPDITRPRPRAPTG